MNKEELIETGVTYLQNFGFKNATKENIFTDDVYTFHFKRFLMLTKGKNFEMDKVIDALIEQINLKWNIK